MGALYGLGTLWIVLVIAYFIGCLALGGWLASEKGYSVGSWIVLLLLFGVLALIVLVGAPDKKNQGIAEKQNDLLKQLLRHFGVSDKPIEDEVVLEENEFIISEKVTLYENPDSASKIVCSLLKGEIVTVIEKKRINNILWYNLEDKDNNIGWCII